MTSPFEERLNHILPRLISPDVLSHQGAGGEIGFWVFDYPPEQEMAMRTWLQTVIEPGLCKHRPTLRFETLNLFQFVIELLQERKLLDKALDMQAHKGDAAVLTALRSVLKEDRLAERMTRQLDVTHLDLLIVTGVGAAYPLLRTHTLLSALHPHMRHTPLLMLYPGTYDGQSLHLFNALSDDHYYRAFRLVP
jgi:hypothetical protein